jgi:branched-chain amino acid transport system ATP-binding protein
MNSALLKVQDMSSGYEGTNVVDKISFSLEKGEVGIIMGPNGSGKTTLMKTLAGQVRNRSGEIWFRGTRIDNLSPEKRAKLGLILCPEGRLLFPNLTVKENLIAGLSPLGILSRKDDQRIKEVTEWFPVLKSRIDQKAGTLSGGEQQMLAIARALMSRPGLILLDEPTLGLSPAMINVIGDLIDSLRDQGFTLLIADQSIAKKLGSVNHKWRLDEGRMHLTQDWDSTIQIDDF